MEKAHRKGDAWGTYNLAVIAEEGGDTRTARGLYQEAANSGYILAFFPLAQILYHERKLKPALKWFTKAGRYGDVDAIYNSAYLLENAGDFEQAHFQYERAARLGDVASAYRSGCCLFALSQPEDARIVLTRAAEMGSIPARVALMVTSTKPWGVESLGEWAAEGDPLAGFYWGLHLVTASQFQRALQVLSAVSDTYLHEARWNVAALLHDSPDPDLVKEFLNRTGYSLNLDGLSGNPLHSNLLVSVDHLPVKLTFSPELSVDQTLTLA